MLLQADGIVLSAQIGVVRADDVTAEIYQQALEARFLPPYECPPALSYQLVRDLDSEQHLWLAPPSGQSTSMRCLPGESHAFFNATLISYVLEAFACFSVMPIGARRTAPVEYQVTPDIKSVSGRLCTVVQAVRQERTKRRVIRELWIDKEIGYRIRQCTVPGSEPVKIHIEYSNEPENVLPRRITVVRLTATGEVADELVAVAAPQDTDTASGAISKKGLPIGTIVSDFVLSQRKVVNADGPFRKLSESEVPSGGDTDRLITGRNPLKHRWDLTLLQWLKWPRFIVLIGPAPSTVAFVTTSAASATGLIPNKSPISVISDSGIQGEKDGKRTLPQSDPDDESIVIGSGRYSACSAQTPFAKDGNTSPYPISESLPDELDATEPRPRP